MAPALNEPKEKLMQSSVSNPTYAELTPNKSELDSSASSSSSPICSEGKIKKTKGRILRNNQKLTAMVTTRTTRSKKNVTPCLPSVITERDELMVEMAPEDVTESCESFQNVNELIKSEEAAAIVSPPLLPELRPESIALLQQEDHLPSLLIPGVDEKEISTSVDNLLPTLSIDSDNVLVNAHDDSGSHLSTCEELTNFQLRVSTSSDSSLHDSRNVAFSLDEQTPTLQEETRMFKIENNEIMSIKTESTVTASENGENTGESVNQFEKDISSEIVFNDFHTEESSNLLLVQPSTSALATVQEYTHNRTESPNEIFPDITTFQSGMQSESPVKFKNISPDPVDPVLEEMLQSFHAPDSLNDLNLNAILNEVYTNYSNYEEPSCINTEMALPQVMEEKSLKAPSKSELLKQQSDLDAIILRHELIQQRIRKLQTHNVCNHISKEIASIFEWAARAFNTENLPIDQREQLSALSDKNFFPLASDRPNPASWDEFKGSSVSLAQIRKFLQELEATADKQQVCKAIKKGQPLNAIPQKKTRGRPMQANFADNCVNQIQASEVDKKNEVVPRIDVQTATEFRHVFGLVHAGLREVQKAYDSDATESSSGAESADEFISYNNDAKMPLEIKKRAAWRYSCGRAAISERWTFMLTQIMDLEIQLKQYKDNLQHHLETKDLEYYDKKDEHQVSRAIPMGRNRKKYVLLNDSSILKRIPRPTTTKCSCYGPSMSCVLCLGSDDPTNPRECINTMGLFQRIASVDPGFHPKLSFLHDARMSTELEGICRQGEWQNRVSRIVPKSLYKQHLRAERDATNALSVSRRANDARRRYVKRKNNRQRNIQKGHAEIKGDNVELAFGNGTTTCSTPIATPVVVNIKSGLNTTTNEGGQVYLPLDASRKNLTEIHFNPNENHMESNEAASLFGLSNNGKIRGKSDRMMERRAQRPSFDIDNIVIPHSVAASIRPELLTYNDILTPGWRMLDKSADIAKNNGAIATHNSSTPKSNVKRDSEEQSALTVEKQIVPKPDLEIEKSKLTEIQLHDFKMYQILNASEKAVSKFSINGDQTSVDKLCSTNKLNEFNDKAQLLPTAISENVLPAEVMAELAELADESILARHHAALTEEKLKHTNIYPYKTRARIPRLSESKPTSSGANTPNPGSPAQPSTQCDNASSQGVPSPFIQGGTLPNACPADNISSDGFQMFFNKQQEGSRGSTPDLCLPVPPYEPVQFPMSDKDYEILKNTIPTEPTAHHFHYDLRLKEIDRLEHAIRTQAKRRREKKCGREDRSKPHKFVEGYTQRASSTGALHLSATSTGDAHETGSEYDLLDDDVDFMTQGLLVPNMVEENETIAPKEPIWTTSVSNENVDVSDIDDEGPNAEDDRDDPEWRRSRRKARPRTERSRKLAQFS